MQPGQLQERPPYAVFETRAHEDRAASVAQGRYVAKNVIYIVVTPAGSRDRIYAVAEEWLAKKAREVRDGRFLQAWLDYYETAYNHYKRGLEIPENGTSVKNWPLLDPAKINELLKLNIRTVEDLAAANEETINRLGMGARALKDKATAWLEAQNNPAGKFAEQITALQQQCETLASRNAALEAALKQHGLAAQGQSEEGEAAIGASDLLDDAPKPQVQSLKRL